MRIVLASMWFPVGVGAYLLRAARRIPGLEVTVVGPTTGARCWTEDFQYPAHAITPDFVGHDPRGDFGSLVYEVEHAVADGNLSPPDLWIDIDGAFFTDGRMSHWPHAIVATDPHIPEQGEHWTYRRQREVADFFFNMQRPYCQNGSDGGLRRPDFHLPYAYDSAVFRPTPEVPQDAHVSVLGVPYPKRIAVAKALAKRGFRVLAGMGDVYEDYNRALNRAPVCFVWSLKDDVPCRVFEAAACGRLIVVNDSIQEHILQIEPRLNGHVAFFEEAKGEAGAVDAIEAWFRISQGASPPRIQGPVASWMVRGEDARIAILSHTWEARLRTIVRTCLGKEL